MNTKDGRTKLGPKKSTKTDDSILYQSIISGAMFYQRVQAQYNGYMNLQPYRREGSIIYFVCGGGSIYCHSFGVQIYYHTYVQVEQVIWRYFYNKTNTIENKFQLLSDKEFDKKGINEIKKTDFMSPLLLQEKLSCSRCSY